MTSRCQSSLPSARSKHNRERVSAVASPPPPTNGLGGHDVLSDACVTNTRLPHTIGEELPSSGSGAFQRTFSIGLHLSGRSFSAECPSPVGPRHAGQFSARATLTSTRKITHNRRAARI